MRISEDFSFHLCSFSNIGNICCSQIFLCVKCWIPSLSSNIECSSISIIIKSFSINFGNWKFFDGKKIVWWIWFNEINSLWFFNGNIFNNWICFKTCSSSFKDNSFKHRYKQDNHFERIFLLSNVISDVNILLIISINWLWSIRCTPSSYNCFSCSYKSSFK